MFSEAMHRSAAETKYTVRVPFFGVAFDINDLGILGGFGLWIVLILLRLSLRSQIVSLRVGFKEAFARSQEIDFYQILAARQVFVFPPLSDEKQQVIVIQGWIEKWWRQSKIGKLYHKARIVLLRLSNKARGKILAFLNIKENSFNENIESSDKWQANRNVALRMVPKGLSLLPFVIYLIQFINDINTINYGIELHRTRTLLLQSWSGFILLNTFVFGVWCITKWNELDKLWDYYNARIQKMRDQRAISDEENSKAGS
jgi:hypothetical protein